MAALITAFLSVDSPQLEGPKFDQSHSSGPNGALNATISARFLGALLPEGLKVTSYNPEKVDGRRWCPSKFRSSLYLGLLAASLAMGPG